MKRAALLGLVASVVAIALAYAAAFLPGGAPAWAAWLMATGTAGCMVSTMALGAARNGRIGVLMIPFALVFLVLVGGFGLALALPGGEGAGTPLWLGLPPRAAVVIYGVGLLPLFALPLAYALTFDAIHLSQSDLDRVRAAARALRHEQTGHAPEAPRRALASPDDRPRPHDAPEAP